MLSRISCSPILKESLVRHGSQVQHNIILPLVSHKSTLTTLKRLNRKNGNEYDYDQFKPQQSSIFRSLLGITGVVGSAALILYLSPQARDYVAQTVPQLKPYIDGVSEVFDGWKKNSSSLDLSSFTPFEFPKKKVSVSPEDTGVGPTFPSTSDAMRIVGGVKESIKDIESEIHTAISHTEKAVSNALADLRTLHTVTGLHLNDQQGALSKLEHPSSLRDKVGAAERKAKESHQNAQKQLAKLRALLDSAKENMSEKEKELVKSAIARYSDFAYDLSGLVIEIRRLQNQSSVYLNLAKADNEDKVKLQDKLSGILPKSLPKLRKEDGSEMTVEEVNSLLAMSLERIDKLQESLKSSGEAAKQHIAEAIQKYKMEADRITQEAVERAVHREQVKHELERFEWEKQAKANTQHELNAALARHGHHLAQMLRLKQEELESQFDLRMREALEEQKVAIEGEIYRWIRRMEAIEHVVDCRANIDRVAKETQALWLAVESLAFALEMPFSKIGATSSLQRQSGEFKPFYVSEPLGSYVETVKETAGPNHEFAAVVVDSLPEEVLTKGVYTRQGLLHRFNKVYKTACNVALVGETGGSLWSYAISWLQARLLFDSLGRRRMLSRLPGVGTTLLIPESEWPEDESKMPDTFCLLTSARAALMPETDTAVNVDPTNCADIEFAVRLLSQLRGQPASVAADWIRDARRFLEVHQAVQALLSYATAQNVSVFEERL